MRLQVNGQWHDVPALWVDDALLQVLREVLGLVGTRMGCGTGECGCCLVHADGQPLRSCLIRARDAQGMAITTIEGLADPDGRLHPVQQAWLDESVSQCGYCQSGQLMEAAALLAASPQPTDADIEAAFATHPCRCGTQARIARAVRRAAETRTRR